MERLLAPFKKYLCYVARAPHNFAVKSAWVYALLSLAGFIYSKFIIVDADNIAAYLVLNAIVGSIIFYWIVRIINEILVEATVSVGGLQDEFHHSSNKYLYLLRIINDKIVEHGKILYGKDDIIRISLPISLYDITGEFPKTGETNSTFRFETAIRGIHDRTLVVVPMTYDFSFNKNFNWSEVIEKLKDPACTELVLHSLFRRTVNAQAEQQKATIKELVRKYSQGELNAPALQKSIYEIFHKYPDEGFLSNMRRDTKIAIDEPKSFIREDLEELPSIIG